MTFRTRVRLKALKEDGFRSIWELREGRADCWIRIARDFIALMRGPFALTWFDTVDRRDLETNIPGLLAAIRHDRPYLD